MIYDDKIARSLYTINKAAKLFPIARRLIKERLFEDGTEFMCSKEALDQAREVADDLAKSVGLERLYDDRFDMYGSSERKYESELIDVFSSLDINVIDEMEDTEEAMNALEYIRGCYTDMDFSEADFEPYKDILTEDTIESLRYEAEERKDARCFFESVSMLHEMLSSTHIAKNNLYSLKEAVIKRLGLEPVEYHQNENDPSNVLIFYRYGAFSYHLMISADQVDSVVDLDRIKKIETISAENRLDAKEAISLLEAIEVLLGFLGVDIKEKENIIYGKYDACDALGIEKNEIHRVSREEKYAEADYSYDEEYDDYDEYDEDYDF